MKIRSLVTAANIGFMFLLMGGIAAEAAEIKVLSHRGIRPVMEDLGPKFERATGHKLSITFGPAGGVVKLVQGGETADVVITSQQKIDGFVKDGKAVADNVTIVARSGTGVVTRALASALPERVFIIATDLNQAMLDQATADCTANLIQQAEVGGWARRGLQVFVFVT